MQDTFARATHSIGLKARPSARATIGYHVYKQKRCIRILFGNKFSFDHVEFYETCARARPQEINYELENTKPPFNNNNLLTVHNLYKLQRITETFKIKKSSVAQAHSMNTEA